MLNPTPNRHHLGLGLHGYLIRFAPLAFEHERQYETRDQPSSPAFRVISTHFTAPPRVPISPPQFKSSDIPSLSPGELGSLKQDPLNRLRSLYAQ